MDVAPSYQWTQFEELAGRSGMRAGRAVRWRLHFDTALRDGARLFAGRSALGPETGGLCVLALHTGHLRERWYPERPSGARLASSSDRDCAGLAKDGAPRDFSRPVDPGVDGTALSLAIDDALLSAGIRLRSARQCCRPAPPRLSDGRLCGDGQRRATGTSRTADP